MPHPRKQLGSRGWKQRMRGADHPELWVHEATGEEYRLCRHRELPDWVLVGKMGSLKLKRYRKRGEDAGE